LAKSTGVSLASSGAPAKGLVERKAGADAFEKVCERRLVMEAAF
jgi:hypothetical protein